MPKGLKPQAKKIPKVLDKARNWLPKGVREEKRNVLKTKFLDKAKTSGEARNWLPKGVREQEKMF